MENLWLMTGAIAAVLSAYFLSRQEYKALNVSIKHTKTEKRDGVYFVTFLIYPARVEINIEEIRVKGALAGTVDFVVKNYKQVPSLSSPLKSSIGVNIQLLPSYISAEPCVLTLCIASIKDMNNIRFSFIAKERFLLVRKRQNKHINIQV